MTTTDLFSTVKATVARTLIGGDVIADTRNDLLKQVLVAVANKTSGGGGGSGTVTSVSVTTQNGVSASVATPTTTPEIAIALDPSSRPTLANLRITHSVLTFEASVALDFDGDGFQTVTLTGVITFTTSNLAAGRSKTIRIIGDSSERALTFPGGWTFVGAAAPATLAANKDAVLTLTSFGTTDADIVAAYAAEP